MVLVNFLKAIFLLYFISIFCPFVFSHFIFHFYLKIDQNLEQASKMVVMVENVQVNTDSLVNFSVRIFSSKILRFSIFIRVIDRILFSFCDMAKNIKVEIDSIVDEPI